MVVAVEGEYAGCRKGPVTSIDYASGQIELETLIEYLSVIDPHRIETAARSKRLLAEQVRGVFAVVVQREGEPVVEETEIDAYVEL